jgi:hypothetical protein
MEKSTKRLMIGFLYLIFYISGVLSYKLITEYPVNFNDGGIASLNQDMCNLSSQISSVKIPITNISDNYSNQENLTENG